MNRQDPLIGRTVGRYRLSEKIGAGGMGSVYLAYHTEISDLVVAIKLLAQNCLDNESLRQRFRDEAAICARLGERSLHIVQIRDYGILNDLDQPYYAMELLVGRSLAEVIRPGGPYLSIEQAISTSCQLCAGLKVAHEAGVVHRDLKPSNIFLIPDSQFGERAKILDFGIAKFLNEASRTDSRPLTQGYIGTPRYSSPEQLSGGTVDCRSDLYSLGVILYELLCGESPFAVADESFISWYRAHQETPPRSMTTANPTVAVPPEVEMVIQQCLSKDPQKRPADAGEVSLRLENALRRFNDNRRREEGQPQPSSLEAPKPAPRSASWPWVISLSAALMAAMVGGGLLVSPPKDGLKSVHDAIAQARQAADQERWPAVFEQLEKASAPSGSAEDTQVKELINRATSGQLALIKAQIAEQKWKEGYIMAKFLIDHADGVNIDEARKLLDKISNRWGVELLQGALSNGNLGKLQDDKILLRQAIETARQVPPESRDYASAKRYIKEWEDALKTL